MTIYIDWKMQIVKSELSPNAKYLALYLNTFMNPRNDTAWPSIKTICGETGLSNKTIIKYLRELDGEGWIEKHQRWGGSTQYEATFPSSFTKVIMENTPNSVVPVIVEEVHRNSVPSTPSIVEEVHTNKQMNKQTNKQEGVLPKTTRFKPPTVDEVRAYIEERQSGIDPDEFVDHYTGNGWMRGKTKIKDWKACVRTWDIRRKKSNGSGDQDLGVMI